MSDLEMAVVEVRLQTATQLLLAQLLLLCCQLGGAMPDPPKESKPKEGKGKSKS
jgi:hypothetical protein